MTTRLIAIIAAVLAGFALVGTAHAQTGCTVTVQGQSIVVAGCTVVTATPAATRTPVRTATPTKTATATATVLPATATATATLVPPTATSTPVPPTATNTPQPAPAATMTAGPPVQASGAMTVNVPLLLDAPAGDARLDANNRAIVWAGDISPAGGYAQARLIGMQDGVSVYVQAMTPDAGGSFSVAINGRTYPGTLRANDGWTYSGTGIGWRGWGAWRLIPWGELGGAPKQGDVWPLTLTALDGDTWTGAIRWGLPASYMGQLGAYTMTVPIVADASLGGGTDCGTDDDPLRVPQLSDSWFRDWGSVSRGMWGEGTINLGAISYANVQTQWDTTDWPCYARYIAKWAAPQLPAGATLTGAWLDVYYFGYAYPGPSDVQEFVPHQVTQAWSVSPDWDEATVTWDSAPAPLENLSATSLDWCDTGTDCRGWRAIDVTEAVKRGNTAALLYTAAGQYHAGRYIYTREGGAPPALRISYTLGGETPTWTPTPAASSTPTSLAATATPSPTVATSTPVSTATATSTRQPTPTVPATASATPRPTATATPTPEPTIPIQPAAGRTYYVATWGSDSAAGGAGTPWRTFARAWKTMQPGDTLLIMDGTYTETIRPTVEGVEGKPITIKAVNDGKVTIDAQGKGYAMLLGDTWPGPIDSWFVVEGIIVRNGYEAALKINGTNIIVRRVSAYDASTDQNSNVIAVTGSSNILLEDVIAVGTARKGILVFSSDHVNVRRAYVKWTRWDGRIFCNAGWPAGNGVNFYSSDYVTGDNLIVEGPMADASFGYTNQADPPSATNPNPDIAYGLGIYGSIAINAGMNDDGTVHVYPWVQEGNNCNPTVAPPQPRENPYLGTRVGIRALGQGEILNPVWRDVLSVGAAQMCFAVVRPYGAGVVGGVLDHCTCVGNAADKGGLHVAEIGHEILPDAGTTVTNCYSPTDKMLGEGARLTNRYVDGVLTDTPLWPWPMDDRALAELGYTITERVAPYVQMRNYP